MADPPRPLRCQAAGCDFVWWDNPIPVVAGIVEMPEGVVLVHAKAWPPKVFAPVSGFLEAGEDPRQAIVREVGEELGLEGRVESLVGNYAFPEQNQLILAYHLWAAGEIRLGDELDGHRVIPVEKLRAWGFGTGLAVQDWLRHRTPR
jgi:NADH pyrophosphatase NudC (nudix superfamily)